MFPLDSFPRAYGFVFIWKRLAATCHWIVPEFQAVIGPIAREQEHAGSDIDLMVVGTLQQIDLLPVLRKLENRFRREVNVTLFPPGGVHQKLTSTGHFLSSVMNEKTIRQGFTK
jgi:predicted nucleotidyltransferase